VRGVAKKRRMQEVAGLRVKCSLSVAARQQSWQGGNHFAATEGRREKADRTQPAVPPVLGYRDQCPAGAE
jgi:hypothetical protein